MRLGHKLRWWLLALAVACLIAFFIALGESPHGLTSDQSEYDFGLVWERSSLRFTVTNASSEVQAIKEFARSCGCIQIEPRSARFAPGETKEFVATFDPISRGTIHAEFRQAYREMVVGLCDTGEQCIELYFFGEVGSPVLLDASPPIVRHIIGDPPHPSDFRVRINPQVDFVGVACYPEYANIVVDPSSSYGELLVKVSPLNGLAVGRHVAQVVLSFVTRVDGKTIDYSLPIQFEIMRSVHAPEGVYFGEVYATEAFSLTSTEDVAFHILDIEIQGPFELLCTVDEVNKTHVIRIREHFQDERTGDLGSVTISILEAGGAQYDLKVALCRL